MTRSLYRPYALLAILVGSSVDGFVVTQPSSSSLLSPQQHPARYRCAALAVPRDLRRLARYHRPLYQSNSNNDDNIDNPNDNNNNNNNDEQDSVPNNNEAPSEFSRRQRIRQRVADMASKMVPKSISNYAMPEAIASVLKEATLGAVEEVMSRGEDDNGKARSSLAATAPEGDPTKHLLHMIDEAFRPVEESLDEVQENLVHTRSALAAAKLQAKDAIRVVQAAAAAQVQGAATAVRAAGVVAGRTAVAEIYATNNNVDISDLAYDDIDFATSEMAPPFLGEDQCLVPGEAVVRVEKAPENSRRIFAGIDIAASVDTVWDVLTDYANLQQVVPNLAVNLVQQVFPGKAAEDICIDETQSDLEQCKEMASQLKGSVLAQVGGAKVAGIKFSARTTLEVREWPQGLPDFAHFYDEVWDGQSRKERAKDYAKVKLERYRFPRPFAISKLPTRDITMQSVETDDGEFRMYQGVWRLQPLPGCVPEGQDAMRLTYAVEVSPRAYLPVQLIEGRVAKDLCANLEAIRDFVATAEED